MYKNHIYLVYMNTAIVNVKVDPGIKKQAREVAEELGFSLSAYINASLRHLIKTKTIHFSSLAEEPTEYLLDSLRKSREDIKAGRTFSFKDPSEALAFADKMIADERKSLRH